MKRILWLLILVPLFISKVNANENYYSEYSNFTDYSENVIDGNELLEVKKEVRYRWYKETKTKKDYSIYNNTDSFDLNDCYYDEFSNWSMEKPSEDGKLIETRSIYTYSLIKEVRYIHLTNLIGSYEAIRLPELTVKVKDKNIDYKYICVGCREGFDNTIHDGVIDKNESYIDNNGSLIIDLGASYPADDIKLLFYIFDMGASNVSYTLGYSKDKNPFGNKDFILERETFWGSNKFVIREHNIYDLGLTQDLLYDKVITYSAFDSQYIRNVETNYEYRYKNKWCMAYDIKKEYLDDYHAIGTDEYNQKGESKNYYRSRSRDKLELISPLLIERYDYDLTKLVANSTKDYLITSNINQYKNGTYQINFKTDNIDITKDIYVKIDQNIISEYEDIIKSLEDQLKDLNEQAHLKEQEFETKINELNLKIEQLEKALINCQEECSIDKDCLQTIINDKNKIIADYEQEILNLSSKINDLQTDLNNKIEQINNLILENDYYKDQLLIYKDRLEIIIKESKETNELIIKEYKEKISKLNTINNIYYEKIKELEKQLSNQNIDIGIVINEKNDLINELKDQIKQLEKSLNQENNSVLNYEKIAKEYDDKNNENEQLQSKISNYLLKIDNNKKEFSFWIYIVILINLFLFVAYKMRKKSSVKKN